MNKQQKIDIKILIVFGIIMLLILVVFFLVQQKKVKKETQLKMQFIEQKNMLRDELDDLIDQHDDLLDEYGDLNNQLHKKDSLIQHQISEIRNLIRTKNDLEEARKKIEVLKTISKKYLANIDSLLVINEQLTIEKDSVINANKDINWKNYKLNKQNKKLEEKVSKGSVLDVFDVEIETIRYRSTGREVNTKSAKKVQKIRICFSLSANQIADPGIKTLYMQLINQNRKLIAGQELIKIPILDSTIYCTQLAEFEYNNTEMNHCFEWERIEVLNPGTYLITLIFEQRIVTQKQITLR